MTNKWYFKKKYDVQKTIIKESVWFVRFALQKLLKILLNIPFQIFKISIIIIREVIISNLFPFKIQVVFWLYLFNFIKWLYWL